MSVTDTRYHTLAQLQAWLREHKVGEKASLRAANFSSAAVATLMTAINGDGEYEFVFVEIVLTNEKAKFTVTGEFLGQVGCTLVFEFTQAMSPTRNGDELVLLAKLNVKGIDNYTIPLGADYRFTLRKPVFVFTPRDYPLSVQLTASAELIGGGRHDGLNFSREVQIDIPADPSADWTIAMGTKTETIEDDVLAGLWANTNPRELMPTEMVEGFALNALTIAFNLEQKIVSFVRLGLAYKHRMSIFDGLFALEGIGLEMGAYRPFGAGQTFEGRLAAALQFGTVTAIVSAQMTKSRTGSEIAFFAELPPRQGVTINGFFDSLGLTLPEDFPTVTLSVMTLAIYYSRGRAAFQLTIDEDVRFTDAVALKGVRLAAETIKKPNELALLDSKIDVAATFTLGDATLKLAGSYDAANGYALSGEARKIAMDGFIDGLADTFGIARADLPDALRQMTLNTVQTKLKKTTNKTSFSFQLDAQLPVGTTTFQVVLKLEISKSRMDLAALATAKWEIKVSGTLFLKFVSVPKPKAVALTIDFESKDKLDAAAKKYLTAVYAGGSGGAFSITDLAKLCDLTMPEIPDWLDLAVAECGFVLDLVEGGFAFGLTLDGPARFGCSVASLKSETEDGPRVLSFVTSVAPMIDLLGLPLFSGKLPAPEELRLDQLRLAFSGLPIPDKKRAAKINTLIAKLVPPVSRVETMPGPLAPINRTDLLPPTGVTSTFPTFPDQGMEGKGVAVFDFLVGADGRKEMQIVIFKEKIAEAETSDFTWYDIQKSFGPISARRVGFRYANRNIEVALDAGIKVKALAFEMVGLGIAYDMKEHAARVLFKGMTAGYASDTFTLAGGLFGDFDPIDLYGALTLKVGKFGLGGLAGYADLEHNPSFFVYGVVNVPLGGDPAMFVTGLAAGFGFNRALNVPEVGALHEFPLITWAVDEGPKDTADDNIATQVRDVLAKMTETKAIAPKLGAYWGAVGVRFTTYKMVDSFVLLAVAFGDRFEIDLLGLSTLKVPVRVPKTRHPAGLGADQPNGVAKEKEPDPIAVVQFVLKASYASETGRLLIAGQLTPASYCLARACHLLGGFAVAVWFAPSPHAGDFVVTFGGYNQKFVPPTHYPTPPAIGLDWKLGETIHIDGGLYFAINPKAVMAGVTLKAVWKTTDVEAWFKLQADFLMAFSPMTYDLTAMIELGARVKVHVPFSNETLDIHVGAALRIWGPDFSLVARIDLTVISVTLTAGNAESDTPKTISWRDFLTTFIEVSKERPSATPLALAKPTVDEPQPISIAMAEGVIKKLSEKQDTLNWIVDVETAELRVVSAIPFKRIDVPPGSGVVLAPDRRQPRNAVSVLVPNVNFGVKPVGLAATDFLSVVSVVVEEDRPNEGAESDALFELSRILAPVGSGLWDGRQVGLFDGQDDPMSDTTLPDVMTGVALRPAPAKKARSLPVRRDELVFSDVSPAGGFMMPVPTLPPDEIYRNTSVAKTIADPKVAAQRSLILEALRTAECPIESWVDPGVLADADKTYLLIDPRFCPLGG